MSDLIERQAVRLIEIDDKSARNYRTYNLDDAYDDGFYDAISAVLELPSAEPEQKTGKWIGGELGFCTRCGHEGCASDIWDRCTYTFCPNCGAYLEVEGIS